MRESRSKLEKVERLLRQESGIQLSPDFKGNLMQEISKLPAPELTTPPTPHRDWMYVLRTMGTGEKVAAALIACAAVVLFFPGALEVLGAWDFHLVDIEVSLSIGESVFSASVMGMVAVAIGVLFMAGVGAYSAKNNLISI